MKEFDSNRLLPLTRSMFEGQQKWSDRNWKETLSKHYRSIEKLVEKTQVFAIWKKRLGARYHDVAKKLIPEIFMDAYMSIDFACMGLYKQANICLRAQLETTLRLVYFSTHQVEFKWWQSGSEWYLGDKDVWGNEHGVYSSGSYQPPSDTPPCDLPSSVESRNKITGMAGRKSPEIKPGVCFPWEQRVKDLPEITGDPAMVQKIWEDIDALGNMYIWQMLLSF